MTHHRGAACLQAAAPLTEALHERDVLAARLRLADLAEAAGIRLTGPIRMDLTHTGADVPGWEHWTGRIALALADGTLPAELRPGATVHLAATPALAEWTIGPIDPDRYEREAVDARLHGHTVLLSQREYAAAARIGVGEYHLDARRLAARLTRPGLVVTPAAVAAADLVLAS